MKLKLKARAFQRYRGNIRSSTISAVTMQERQEAEVLDNKITKKLAAGHRPWPFRCYYVAYNPFYVDYRISNESLGPPATSCVRRVAFSGQ
jgi:hypothetical protein